MGMQWIVCKFVSTAGRDLETIYFILLANTFVVNVPIGEISHRQLVWTFTQQKLNIVLGISVTSHDQSHEMGICLVVTSTKYNNAGFTKDNTNHIPV